MVSLFQQRINNNDRIEYTQANPFKLQKYEASGPVKLIQSNVITRFAYSTREGYSANNIYKKNQDNFILAPNLCQTYHQHFFSVCDGHGQNGQQSSMMVKMNMSQCLSNFITQGKENQKGVLSEPDPEEKDENHFDVLNQRQEKIITDSLYNCMIKQQTDLETNGQFNVQLSGTTVTSTFFDGNVLYTANVGDSRTILISVDENDGKNIKVR